LDSTFTVRLSVPSSLPISVDFATSNRTAIAGVDYLPVSGTVHFPPGSTSQPVIVKIIGDVLDEPSETYEVNLFSPVNAAIIDSQALGRINDDDATPSLRISDTTVTEPAPGEVTSAIFNVTLSAPSALPVFVSFITSNGTAVADR